MDKETPPQSNGEPFRGPYAVFTDAELETIRKAISGSFVSPDQFPICISIIAKIDTALMSAPQFKEPFR